MSCQFCFLLYPLKYDRTKNENHNKLIFIYKRHFEQRNVLALRLIPNYVENRWHFGFFFLFNFFFRFFCFCLYVFFLDDFFKGFPIILITFSTEEKFKYSARYNREFANKRPYIKNHICRTCICMKSNWYNIYLVLITLCGISQSTLYY